MTEPTRVVYWDASAVLPLLFAGSHTGAASAWMTLDGTAHLLSSLAYAETSAVIARLQRERALSDVLAGTAWNSLASWPWRRITVQPDWEIVSPLARKWPLRGADLWHLACARGLQRQLPELHLLTFDARLQEATRGEGLLQP
ncbi:MAG: PIN domain-containing protein [Desulfurivibrio sp.]|nr:MAG: PIN domain-containing protein [Desulfurivibrio sp.]